MTDAAIANFKPDDPSASVPALLEIRSRVAALAADPVVEEKRHQLDRLLQDCLGLSVQTTLPEAEVVPGEVLKLTQIATVRSSVPVRWVGSALIPAINAATKIDAALVAGQPLRHDSAPDPTRQHAAEPAVLAARAGNGGNVPRGRCEPDRPAGESAGVSRRIRV